MSSPAYLKLVEAGAVSRPLRGRRVDEAKADAAFAGFELAESSLRHTLTDHLPFSGLVITAEEVAELRAIADRLSIISAVIEARIADQ